VVVDEEEVEKDVKKDAPVASAAEKGGDMIYFSDSE
jgi:hypothetical protein